MEERYSVALGRAYVLEYCTSIQSATLLADAGR
jgi:hypothetical protein